MYCTFCCIYVICLMPTEMFKDANKLCLDELWRANHSQVDSWAIKMIPLMQSSYHLSVILNKETERL